MRKSILLLGALAFSIAAPTLVSAQGKGKGSGASHKAHGRGHADRAFYSRDDRALERRFSARADRGERARSCPPGLAKKNNGCLPPGIAKKRLASGDRLPTAYRINNVPAEYADRYRDSDRSLFRYNDGNVYRVDPTTRRILEIINLPRR